MHVGLVGEGQHGDGSGQGAVLVVQRVGGDHPGPTVEHRGLRGVLPGQRRTDHPTGREVLDQLGEPMAHEVRAPVAEPLDQRAVEGEQGLVGSDETDDDGGVFGHQ